MMFHRRVRTGFLSALLIFALASAASAAPFIMDGAKLYKEYCLVCHGDKGDGNTRVRRGLSSPPRDFTTARAHRELSRERMINSVAHGRPGTAMMAFEDRLNEDQIGVVVDYIRATFMAGEGSADRPPKMVRGEQLYVRHCAVCHGDRGSGAVWTQSSLNPPPRNFTTAHRDVLTRERMITSVTYGRPGTAMMSFRKRLSPEDIETVVDYIRANFLGTAVPATAAPPPVAQVDMSLPFPHGLRGDIDKGRAFFNNNCFTCHGREGNGQGPRSKFLVPKPRNFLTAESRRRFNRPALFKAVRDGVEGSVMPSWGKVLTDQQIADVAEYVFEAFIHPASAHTDPPPTDADKKKLP
jgi:cbb3-type cytochrome c oxidase subunit III